MGEKAKVNVFKGDSFTWFPGNGAIRFAQGHSKDYHQKRKKKGGGAMAFGLWAVFQIKFAKLGSILGSPRDH